jgi:hypothetical protein
MEKMAKDEIEKRIRQNPTDKELYRELAAVTEDPLVKGRIEQQCSSGWSPGTESAADHDPALLDRLLALCVEPGLTEIVGPPLVGKSTLAYQVAAHEQRLGQEPVFTFLDNVHGDPYLSLNGVDQATLLWLPPDTADFDSKLSTFLQVGFPSIINAQPCPLETIPETNGMSVILLGEERRWDTSRCIELRRAGLLRDGDRLVGQRIHLRVLNGQAVELEDVELAIRFDRGLVACGQAKPAEPSESIESFLPLAAMQRWRFGFLREASVVRIGALRALMACEAARFLESLDVHVMDLPEIEALLDCRPPLRLFRLRRVAQWTSDVDLASDLSQAFPQLKTLELAGASYHTAIWPALNEARLALSAEWELDAVCESTWPELRVLSLTLDGESFDPEKLEPLQPWSGLDKLEILELRNWFCTPAFLLQLGNSLPPALQVLDLSGGAMTDDSAKALVKLAKEHERFSGLRLVVNGQGVSPAIQDELKQTFEAITITDENAPAEPRICDACNKTLQTYDGERCEQCDRVLCYVCHYDRSNIDESEFEAAVGHPLDALGQFELCPRCLNEAYKDGLYAK